MNFLIRAKKATGEIIGMSAEKAYYDYRLTLEDLFTKRDCDKVLENMKKLGIVSCHDAGVMINELGNSNITFSLADVLNIRQSLN